MNAQLGPWVRVRAVGCALAACVVAPESAAAQAQWNVVLTPTMDPLPAGFCAAIHLTVRDSAGRDVPRNPLGYRVTIADFDITVASPDGRSAIAQRIDATHWSACACQGATPGTVATVTATYPSPSLAASSRIPGVSVQRSATFALSAARGAGNPAGCSAPPTLAATPLGVATPSTRTAAGGNAAPTTPPTAAPIQMPAPRQSPAPAPATSAPAPATSSPAPAPLSGNYLVTLTGVRAFQTSYENLLVADGMGDEVYASAYVRRYKRPTGASPKRRA